MVELQHISTPSKSSCSSDQTSPSSSSPTSPLPSNCLPQLLFPPPPSSSSPPFPFNMFSSPTPLYHPTSYYWYSYYFYYYPFPNYQHPSIFYYYPQTDVISPFLPHPPSNNAYGDGDSQPFSPMDVPVFNTQHDPVLQPQPQPQPQPPAPVVPAAGEYYGNRKQFPRRTTWNHGGVRVSKKKLKAKQKGTTRKSEHAIGCGSPSHLPPPQALTPPPSSAPHLANCTTVMVKNIPNSLRRDLINMLDRHCREQNSTVAANPCPLQYDFLYLPFDFVNKQNLGYAFVNFTTVEGAAKLHNCWSGRGWERCHKILDIAPAKLQGLEKCKKHFEVSRFYCHSEEYLPVEFWPPRDGLNGGVCKTMTIGELAYCANNAVPTKAKSGWDKFKRLIPPRLTR